MVRCQPEYVDSDMKAFEKGVMDNVFVDFKRRGSHYECTTVSSIREICDRNQHCILDIHLGSIERLHQNQIYPIVLLIKFKSVKHRTHSLPTLCQSSWQLRPSQGELLEHQGQREEVMQQ